MISWAVQLVRAISVYYNHCSSGMKVWLPVLILTFFFILFFFFQSRMEKHKRKELWASACQYTHSPCWGSFIIGLSEQKEGGESTEQKINKSFKSDRA